jgi:hypothetical protein
MNEYALEMATSAIRFGFGVTREVELAQQTSTVSAMARRDTLLLSVDVARLCLPVGPSSPLELRWSFPNA